MDPLGAQIAKGTRNDDFEAKGILLSADIHSAGTVLVVLASKDSHGGRRRIFDEEMQMLDDCFERGAGTPGFEKYHIEAVRKAVESWNLQMVQLLLSRDTTHQLLRNDLDILQLVLCSNIHREDSESLQEMMSLVIDHGAQVNAIASNGDTALYLTCDYGLPQAFNFLIEAGANSLTTHHRKPIKQTGSGTSSPPVETQSELNLLQVTLDARLRDESQGPANTAYADSLKARWGIIIEYLFNAGMMAAPEDPALVKLLHVACYQGHMDYVEMILRHGVDVHAKAARVDDRDTVYGSALHAAAAGGHKQIVLRLLAHGADPRTARLQEYMKDADPDEILTPIAAALRPPKFSPRTESEKLLDVCEAIIAAGVTEADRKLVVLECAKSGSIDRLRRLLQPEITVDQVPLCSSIEAITILLDHGTAIEAKEFQKYAVTEGLIELMKFLVERFGPLLTVKELRNTILRSTRRQEDTETLEYLIREYGHHASSEPSRHGNVAADLLRTFFETAKLEPVRSLLQDATKSGCPGVRKGTLTALAAMLHQYWLSDYHVHDKMTKERVQLYQILLAWNDQADHSGNIDDSKLWLTPDNLPPHIYDLINTIPIDVPSKSGPSHLRKGFIGRKGMPKKRGLAEKTGFLSKIGLMNKRSLKGNNKTITAEKDDRIDQTLQTASRKSLDNNRDQTGDARQPIHSLDNSDTKPDSTFVGGQPPFTDAAHCSLCAKNYGFKYDRLDGSFAIRIISVEPSPNPEATLRCQLITTNLGTHPEYEALSYAWGELSDSVNIILNGIDFAVTKNLGSALRRLRFPDRQRRLWVDAICIDQNFLHERNQQVRIMREIYQESQQTLVWVGEEADDSHLIFEHIKKWTTYRDDYLAGRTKKNDPWGEAHLNMPLYTGNTRTAFEKFCCRSYWFRTWVTQEVVVSKEVIVNCGRDQEKLGLIANGTSFSMGNLYDPFQGLNAITHFYELHELTQNSNLKSILRYSRFCEASDPRDKVFGLLGLFTQPLITVDYALDAKMVFRDFTEAIIRKEEKIEFLHWLGISERHVHELPSWVPDFTASKPTGILPRVYHYGHVLTTASKSLRKILPGFRIDGHRLVIQGTHLDTVRDIGVVLLADPTTYPESAPFIKTMHHWEEIAAGLVSNKRYSTPITEAFLKTLTGGQSTSMLWYLNFGSGTLRDLEEDVFNEYEVLRAWRRDGDGSDENEDIALSHFKRELNECCYGRRLFITEKGSMGLAPPDARKGDQIVFFSGALYPFVLRPSKDGSFAMLGDCYLYEPRSNSLHYDDFDEHMFYQDDIYRDVTEWVIL